MPYVVNPYRAGQSSLGKALTDLGSQVFGGDQLGPALKREQLLAAQRSNVEMQNLMNAASGGDINMAAAAPAIIGSGYDPADFFKLNLGLSANKYGAASPQAQNAQVGAGQSYTNTADAFFRSDATDRRGQDIASSDRRYNTDRDYAATIFGINTRDATERRGQDIKSADSRYEFDNKPVETMVGGKPVYTRQSEVFNPDVAPVLKPDEMSPQALYDNYYKLAEDTAAASGVPFDPAKAREFAMSQAARRSAGRNIKVGPDGVEISEGGIGGLTSNVQSTLQKQSIENEIFKRTSALASEYLINPENANLFGIVGAGRQMVQGGLEAAGALAQTLGYESPQQLRAEVQDQLVRNGAAGFFPNAFDPGLDEVDTLWTMLVYQGAAALAGQEGRSISDKDVALFKTVFGDPKGLFESQQSLRAKIVMANRIVDARSGVQNNALAGRALSDGAPPRPPSSGTISAPDTAGTSYETAIPIENEADAANLVGKYVRLNGQVFIVEP